MYNATFINNNKNPFYYWEKEDIWSVQKHLFKIMLFLFLKKNQSAMFVFIEIMFLFMK